MGAISSFGCLPSSVLALPGRCGLHRGVSWCIVLQECQLIRLMLEATGYLYPRAVLASGACDKQSKTTAAQLLRLQLVEELKQTPEPKLTAPCKLASYCILLRLNS